VKQQQEADVLIEVFDKISDENVKLKIYSGYNSDSNYFKRAKGKDLKSKYNHGKV
jgi:hypothetical protein